MLVSELASELASELVSERDSVIKSTIHLSLCRPRDRLEEVTKGVVGLKQTGDGDGGGNDRLAGRPIDIPTGACVLFGLPLLMPTTLPYYP